MYFSQKFGEDDSSNQFNFQENPSSRIFSQQDYEIRTDPYVTQTQMISSLINPKNEKFCFKNFPKLLGNKLVKKIRKEAKVPNGIQTLKEKRAKTRQSEIKIQDLQQVCKTDDVSRQYFQIFVGYDMFLHVLNSNKIEDPIRLIPVISNYWAAANEPDKMISNSLMNKYFQSQ
ncbi:unnamed protein product [Paramecium octaurelia]|uniref:Uncharacterized protein n=1 Tax=Paramecium octaurelia TaxID=43137 RepID=A0A8S1Y2G0_PAROT|nr:unnamed protein product [Paramecium octaurelia]